MALGDYGEPNNVWDRFSAEGDEATSQTFDTFLGNEFQIIGSAEGAYAMRVQFSQDRKQWFNAGTYEPDDDGHFDIRESGVQARYVRLQALRGPSFGAYEEADNEEKKEPMRLTATLIAKTTR